jgi:glutaredoxin-dependent peroxiredoxin
MKQDRCHLFEQMAKLLIKKVVESCLINNHKNKTRRMKIEIGMHAPGFTLFDSEKNHVSLSNFAGQNVLLLFYPQAFTGVCTKELCAVRDNIGQYAKMNAVVLGISVDSVFTLAKYKEEQGYNFPLLSDFNKDISHLYGSLYENFAFDMKGVSKRSAFVIDKDGIVQYAEVLENAGEMPNFEAIQNTLASLS